MRSAAIVAICALMLSGCVSASPEATAANDPFEPANRAVYKFDQRFDKYVLLPVAGFYFYYMPRPMRRGLHNVLTNLELPATFANDVLQGEFSRAGTTLGRFTLNSTIGLGGFVDVATTIGLYYHHTDFGETLGRYGIPEGPFLVLPIIGPDPPRDLLGDAVDIALNPLFYVPPAAPLYEHALSAGAANGGATFETRIPHIVLRRELERGSVDSYATMRSTYRQVRAGDVDWGLPPMDESGDK